MVFSLKVNAFNHLNTSFYFIDFPYSDPLYPVSNCLDDSEITTCSNYVYDGKFEIIFLNSSDVSFSFNRPLAYSDSIVSITFYDSSDSIIDIYNFPKSSLVTTSVYKSVKRAVIVPSPRKPIFFSTIHFTFTNSLIPNPVGIFQTQSQADAYYSDVLVYLTSMALGGVFIRLIRKKGSIT